VSVAISVPTSRTGRALGCPPRPGVFHARTKEATIMSRTLQPNTSGFRSTEFLFLLVATLAFVGLCIPACWRSHNEVHMVKCTGNLQQIYGMALDYAQRKGNNDFPIGDGKEPAAHESLNSS
jgi:hypothetical protein